MATSAMCFTLPGPVTSVLGCGLARMSHTGPDCYALLYYRGNGQLLSRFIHFLNRPAPVERHPETGRPFLWIDPRPHDSSDGWELGIQYSGSDNIVDALLAASPRSPIRPTGAMRLSQDGDGRT